MSEMSRVFVGRGCCVSIVDWSSGVVQRLKISEDHQDILGEAEGVVSLRCTGY